MRISIPLKLVNDYSMDANIRGLILVEFEKDRRNEGKENDTLLHTFALFSAPYKKVHF